MNNFPGVKEITRSQGPRGFATRGGVVMKYAGWLGLLVLSSVITQAATSGIPLLNNSGTWMYTMAAIQCVTAGLGMIAFANNRNEIMMMLRHYLFGLSVLPGTVIAITIWATYSTLIGIQNSSMASVLTEALPWAFFIAIFIPAIVFVKYITGLRTLNRTNLDDQEAVSLWTRQSDGLAR
jgi:hypothetical protein